MLHVLIVFQNLLKLLILMLCHFMLEIAHLMRKLVQFVKAQLGLIHHRVGRIK